MRVFAILFPLILLLGSCSRPGSQSLPPSSTENPAHNVTFVELGSVNCIPCVKMQAIMRDIEREYGSQVAIVFHDVWTEAGRPYARQYGIRVIPTQVFLDQDGNEYFRHEGYFPKAQLIEVLRIKGVQ